LKDGKVGVVEYSEISKETSHSRDPTTGKLLFNSAHLCMNMFTVPFLDSLSSGLLYHVAKKKIPTIDERGEAFTPKEINGWKLEMFIFDAFEACKAMELLEVSRADEFAPLKNATGSDSPDTCKRALSALHKRWLARVGAVVESEELCEISPALSVAGEGLEHLKGKTVHLPMELK
jgi:UDP-N-acetylglucosamine/UDP-N-acetylgalactosamine diphosphorylase